MEEEIELCAAVERIQRRQIERDDECSNGAFHKKTINCQFKVNYAHLINKMEIKYANRFKRKS